jgi:hypothetical protein|nr:MAG TPA: major capsid protein [Caudoviricetes sp.]
MTLVATKIQAIREKNTRLDKNENRLSDYGALNFFRVQSQRAPILTEKMREDAKRSAGADIQVPVLKYDGTVTVSNTRTCTVADAENTSALVDVTFVTYAVGFTMVPGQYSNNDIDYEKDFWAKMQKCARSLGAALDSAAIAALESNKTKVYADTLLYGKTADTLQVPFGSRENILGDIEPIMEANDFYGKVNIIGNAGVKSILGKLMELGTYNEVDKSLEYEGKDFHFSNRLSNAEGKYATFYAVEEGSVDMLYRYDRAAARGAQSGTHQWDVVNMPFIDIPVGLHYYEEVGDQSKIAGAATADMVCDVKEYYGFSVDVAFIVAYNSAPATLANPIIKAEVAKGLDYTPQVVIANTEANPVPTKEKA